MKLLMIDNYDSFTYNLVQYLGELGAECDVFRNDAIGVEDIADRKPDALILSPGPCTPQQAGVSVETVRRYLGSYPILGVCLGHQSIAAAFGARIIPARTLMHGKTSQIHHDGLGVFAGLPNPFEATRYHSLAIEPESLSEDFEVTARTEDGEIMGIAHRRHAVVGVQFHPESILTKVGKDLLRNFLELAKGAS